MSKSTIKMLDPRTLYQQPPYPKTQQAPPGTEKEMIPKIDHGEEAYQGFGRLKGQHALITGADSGIGRAVALAFAREGADVGISYLSEHEDAKETECLVTKAGQRAALFAGDISQQMVTDDLVRKAINTFGSIDILVNNAAFQRTYESFEDISDEPVDGGNAITEAMQFAERYDAAHSQS
jgi:NAD(P)-dependent dehydrogenase (short-subunit alcohol dehydrogenase family)